VLCCVMLCCIVWYCIVLCSAVLCSVAMYLRGACPAGRGEEGEGRGKGRGRARCSSRNRESGSRRLDVTFCLWCFGVEGGASWVLRSSIGPMNGRAGCLLGRALGFGALFLGGLLAGGDIAFPPSGTAITPYSSSALGPTHPESLMMDDEME
jgi:hypothetical protein